MKAAARMETQPKSLTISSEGELDSACVTVPNLPAVIERTIRTLHPGDHVYELRVLNIPGRGRPHQAAGYFSSAEKAALEALRYEVRQAGGVYITVNPVNPALLSRSDNKIKDYQEPTTSDADVLHRHWLPIDIDVQRPSGISATNDERDIAAQAAHDVEAWLSSKGWSKPLIGDSGNGYWLLYRINLPNDENATSTIKRILEAIHANLGDSIAPAKVDRTVFNAARICRLFGTMNRKGDNTADRPHRRSELFDQPDEGIQIVESEQLQVIAALAPEPNSSQRNGSRLPTYAGGQSKLAVSRWLSDRGVSFTPKETNEGTLFLLKECPFDSSHGTHREVHIGQFNNGATSFSCKHNSCQDKKWADAKQAIGPPDPEHYDPPLPAKRRTNSVLVTAQERPRLPEGTWVRARDRDNFGTVVSDQGDSVTVRFVSPEGNEATKSFSPADLIDQSGRRVVDNSLEIPPPVGIAKLIAQHPRLRPPIIEGLLRRGETANIIAAPKFGKSWLAYELALKVAMGMHWLDTFQCVRANVLLIDNELHPETIAMRIPVVAKALGFRAKEYQDSLDVLPLRGMGVDLQTLQSAIDAIDSGKYGVVIADAWYRFYPPRVNENDNAAIMALYNTIDRYAAQIDAAWVNIHHASRGEQGGKTVTDVGAGAGAQSRATDTHIVLRPHQTAGAVVFEAAVRSFSPVAAIALRWRFPIFSPDRSLDPACVKGRRNRRDEQQQLRDADGKKTVVKALKKDGLTIRELRTGTKMGKTRVERLVKSLVLDGRVVKNETERNGNKTMAYSLVKESEK